MKKSETLKFQLEQMEEMKEKKYYEMVSSKVETSEKDWKQLWDEYYGKCGRKLMDDIRMIEDAIRRELNREIEFGDGVTMCLYSDNYACTVIAKTAKTITIQRDKAIRDPNFKPHFIPGGFAAHCINQEDQRWTYERNPDGEITRCYWSEKLGMYTTGGDRSIKIRLGRHEFYDYNF